jgi:hypothetical protein
MSPSVRLDRRRSTHHSAAIVTTKYGIREGAAIGSPGHARRLLPVVERIAVVRPLDEPLWSAWAQLLRTAGHRRDALNRLAELRTNLREQAGLNPSWDVDAIERRILAEEQAVHPALADPVLATAPTRRRAADRSFVERALRDCLTLTVCGPIGVGTAAIVRELRPEGSSVRTVVASDPNARYSVGSEIPDDRPEPTSSADVLVLLADDVSACAARALARDLRTRWPGRLVVAATAPMGCPTNGSCTSIHFP